MRLPASLCPQQPSGVDLAVISPDPMRFPFFPYLPAEIDIPDEWWTEAGMTGFARTTRAFRSTADALLLPLIQVEPPPRVSTVQKDWRGFDPLIAGSSW